MKIYTLMHLTNTGKVALCKHCYSMAHVLMDKEGYRYCGKCRTQDDTFGKEKLN